MEIDDKIIAVRCDIIINDTQIKAIIDTGAATNIITSALLNELEIEIDQSSRTRFIIANGEKQASLGKCNIDIEIDDWIIPINVEVIENKKKEILLGTQFLAEMEGKINLENKTLTIKVNEDETIVPIYYTQQEVVQQLEDESSEDEYSDEYEEDDEITAYLNMKELDNDNEDLENDGVKEIVLGRQRNRH